MKTHVNVGTIGDVDHGKTTLTAALLAVQAQRGLAQVKTYGDIAKGGTVRHETKTVTIAISHVEYETAVEMFHKEQPEARAGENCGLLLRGVARDEVVRGQVLIAPGSVKSHTKAEAELYVISKEEGGRHTPIFSGYRPQFFFGTTDVTGAVVGFEDGMKVLVPGNHAKVSLELHKPVGMEPGMRFAVREGGRTVGAGVILSVES